VIPPALPPAWVSWPRVSDRAVAIACALQGRTWVEQFYDAAHAVVEDCGGYRGTWAAGRRRHPVRGTVNGDVFGDLAVGGPVPQRIPHRTLRTS
jgi:hypothetical protein